MHLMLASNRIECCPERFQMQAATSKVRGAYLRTQFMPERHKMMQWYADYLDLIQSKNVIPVNFTGIAI